MQEKQGLCLSRALARARLIKAGANDKTRLIKNERLKALADVVKTTLAFKPSKAIKRLAKKLDG